MSPPFRADHVGSLLRPTGLLKARARHEAGKISDDALRAIEDQSIREAVKLQQDLGFEGVTDGEYRRTMFHTDFLKRFDGVAVRGGMPLKFRSVSTGGCVPAKIQLSVSPSRPDISSYNTF